MSVNSRDKGARFERKLASIFRSYGFKDCRRSAQYCGNTGDASDVVGLPGIHQEVKRVERLNIEEAMSQAVRDSQGSKIPVVAHRKNGQGWLVTMRAEDWFSLYREWEAGNEP